MVRFQAKTLFEDAVFSLGPHMVEEVKNLSGASCPKGTNPIHESSSRKTYATPKDPTS